MVPTCHSRTRVRVTCCCQGRFGDSQEQYLSLFGEELPTVAYAWAGSFAETRDGLPLIGRVPGMNPRLQFALCYGGNGITYSVHAGDMIRAGIEGRPHALDDVFGFGRLKSDLSAGRLAS